MSNPSSIKSSGSEAAGANSSMRMLPKTFSPSINEVMIGRGRKVANHAGNDRFQEFIHSQLYEYSRAKTKASKSAIIVRVLNQVRENSHVGGFIKQDSKTKRWFALEDAAARISTAQAFRDALSGTYRSSKQYKQQKRWKQKSNSPITTPSDSLDDDDEEEEEPQHEVQAPIVAPVVTPVFAPPVVKNNSVNSKFAAWKAQDTKDLLPSVSASVSMFGVSPCASPFPFSQQQQPPQQRKASMTMSGLKGILDSALDIMDDDSDFLFGNNDDAPFQLPGFTPATAADEKEDINVFLDSFERNVEFTENPFEPKPISAPSSSTNTSSLQFPQELFFKQQQQQQSPQKWQPLPQQPCMPSALPFAQYKPGGATNNSREQSFSLRDVLSFQPV